MYMKLMRKEEQMQEGAGNACGRSDRGEEAKDGR